MICWDFQTQKFLETSLSEWWVGQWKHLDVKNAQGRLGKLVETDMKYKVTTIIFTIAVSRKVSPNA